MGKKAKTKRKENYKAFLDGMINYRNKFIDQKLGLVEKMLGDDALKNELTSKKRKELSKLERAAVDTIVSRNLENIDQFNELKENIKESQDRSAKFKYTPKEI